MNCEEAIRLIHLDGGGETSAREDAELRAHLLSCEGCASEARLVQQTAHTLRRLSVSIPVLPRPEELVRSIMAGVAESSRLRPRPRGSLDALLVFFARPAVRLSYAVVVLAFVLLFVFQQADMFLSIDALSGKLAQAKQHPVADIQYSMTLEEARGIVGTAELEPFIAGSPLSVSSDRISVRKSDIESWVPSLGSRFTSTLLASSDSPVERLPRLIFDIQNSVTSSFTLRLGGKDQ